MLEYQGEILHWRDHVFWAIQLRQREYHHSVLYVSVRHMSIYKLRAVVVVENGTRKPNIVFKAGPLAETFCIKTGQICTCGRGNYPALSS
jgi:hypothetical protein